MKHRSPEPPRRWLEGWQPSIAAAAGALALFATVFALGTTIAPDVQAADTTPAATSRATYTPRSLPPLRVRTAATAAQSTQTEAPGSEIALSAPQTFQGVREAPERVSIAPRPTPAALTTTPAPTTTQPVATTTASATTPAPTTTSQPAATTTPTTAPTTPPSAEETPVPTDVTVTDVVPVEGEGE